MPPEEIAALQEKIANADKMIAELNKKLEEKNKTPDPAKEEPKDINDKVLQERADRDKADAEARQIESAITFTVRKDQFLAENKDLLPEEMGDIFTKLETETFKNSIDKANASKDAIIKSFFSVQSNMDLATENHKKQINAYLALTQEGRKEKAADVYVNIFEPALETLRRVKKAEQASLANRGLSSDTTDAAKRYKNKLIESSENYYFKRER